jgi:aromatic-amino-acid transaminase
MHAVKAAEARLVAEQASKSYLGADGDARFTELVAELALGGADARRFGLQTPGGTGALRLGAQLLARAQPGGRVWMSQPTWPNHTPIFAEAGLTPLGYPYYDDAGGIAFAAMIQALDGARPGDVVLLHGCCHNPTGTQLSLDQWQAVAAVCNRRGLIPFVDLAYHGLGDGLDADAAGAKLVIDAVPAALLAYSCDKNFALYRDRVGALFVQAPTASVAEIVRANTLALTRSLWSMPPDHGAAVVRIILDDAALRTSWRDELDGMRTRLNGVRTALAAAHPVLAPVARQRGLFSRLPLDGQAVVALRETHAIYMPGDGRINIAGLHHGNLGRFIEALLPHLAKEPHV